MFRQTSAVTNLNLSTLPHRLTSSLVMVIGIAGAVAAMLALLALSSSATKMAFANVSASRALVLPAGATSETDGSLPKGDLVQIAQAPGVARDRAGQPLVQGMAAVAVGVVRKRDNVFDSILLRGTGPIGLEMDPAFKLISGRMFRSGANELIAGRTVAAQYAGVAIGDVLSLRGTRWTVVGIYEDGHGLGELETLADADTVLSTFMRPGYQSVAVQLTSPKEYAGFRDALTANPQIAVAVFNYRAYVANQIRGLTGVLNFVAYLVGAVMAIGAVIAAVNTMFTAVDARAREIATLRAIGFSGGAVLISVMIEALALAIPGALLGAGLVWALMNNREAGVGNATFPLQVTPQLMITGIIVALTVGFLGALAPAIRAARLPVATALRAT